MDLDLRVINHVWEELEGRKIVLYGASSEGRKMIQTLVDVGMDAVAFCDGDSQKWGIDFCNKPVISIDTLKEWTTNDDSYCIIISSCYISEILKDIERKQITSDVYSSFAVKWGFYLSMQEENDVPDTAKDYWEKKKQFVTVEKVCAGSFSSRTSGLNIWSLRNILFQENPIIVFQPAKVGSSSIVMELMEKKRNAIHLHDILLFFKENHASSGERKLLVDAIRNVPKLKIITGVRDPIARDLSIVFSGMGDGAWYLTRMEHDEDFLGKIQHGMMTNTPLAHPKRRPINYNWSSYIKENCKYGAMFDWFDLEIKRFFGIDIFSKSFDKEKGYSIIRKDNVEIFVYKMEKLISWNMS